MDAARSQVNTTRIVMYAGALLLLGALVYLAVQYFATSDEPPIRVKNGSLEIVQCDEAPWEAKQTHWETASGQGHGAFHVTFSTTAGHPCANLQVTGNRMEVYYSTTGSSPQVILLPGGKTRAQPRPPLALKAGQNWVVTNGESSGYISRVDILGQGDPRTCEFPSKDALNYVDLSTNGAYRTCD